MSSAGKFTCESCGKTYSWKAELAGRRVKCKCGQAMTVPREDPALAEAAPEGFEDLYALAEGTPLTSEAVTPPAFSRGSPCPSCGASVESGAVVCVSCGHNLKTGKKVKTKASRGGSGGGGMSAPVLAGAVAGTGGSSPMLAYAAMSARRRNAEDEERGGGNIFFHPVKDLYIPAALILVGTVLSYIVMVSYYNVRSPGLAMLAVGVLTIVNVVLVIPGILLAIKLFDLGIGPIGPGLMKLAACAIAPGAIGDLIGKVILSNGIGGIGGYVGWIVTYVSTVAIFMSLLERDYFEVVVCSAIIFVFRFIGFFVVLGLLSGVGVRNLPSAGFGSGGGRVMISGDIDQEDDESLDGVRARESDAVMSDLLLSGGIEAKSWMEKSPTGIVAGKTHDQSVRLLRSFYDAGTLEIRVYPHKNAKGVDSVNRMIVVPPRADAPGAKDVRVRVMKEMKSLAKDLGRVAPRDRGEKYWPVKMLTDEEAEKEFSEPALPGKSGISPDDDKDDDN